MHPRSPWAAGLALVASLSAAPTPAHAVSASSPEGRLVPSAESDVVDLVNAERRRRGLRALRVDRRLDAAATEHARDMVRRGFFAHVAPGGTSPTSRIRTAGYVLRGGSWRTAENLAWGRGRLASPARIVRGWMRSPGHRHNILNGRLRETGVGVVTGVPSRRSASGLTYVQTFAAR
jgi:uncharacterized protein YkwD